MIKRRSVKKTIESTLSPEIEHRFIKYPGKKPVDTTFYLLGDPSTSFPSLKERTIVKKGGEKHYTHIHTHPEEAWWGKNMHAIPSGQDLGHFLRGDKIKTIAIAVRKSSTGDIIGYTIVRKTKKTPLNDKSEAKGSLINKFWTRLKYEFSHGGGGAVSENEIREYNYNQRQILSGSPGMTTEVFEKFANKYFLQYKFVPAKGYRLEKILGRYEKKEKLEDEAVIGIVVIGLAGLVFFSSLNITGNVISSLNQNYPNWIGGVLFIIGLVGAFVYFKIKQF